MSTPETRIHNVPPCTIIHLSSRRIHSSSRLPVFLTFTMSRLIAAAVLPPASHSALDPESALNFMPAFPGIFYVLEEEFNRGFEKRDSVGHRKSANEYNSNVLTSSLSVTPCTRTLLSIRQCWLSWILLESSLHLASYDRLFACQE